MTIRTKHSVLKDAAICRKKNWKVGTFLVGNEGYGDSVIEITAIGKTCILARCLVARNLLVANPSEFVWTLTCREWVKISKKEITKYIHARISPDTKHRTTKS